jgi:putative glycosyl hydrolase
VTLGNFDLLVKEIDRLYGKRMRIWITEYGYQTNPPDKVFGVTYRKQATYLTQAVAWARRNPRVDIFLWFLLTDEQRLGGWQSGLTTVDGKRKASFRAFQKAVEQYGT